MGSSHSKSAGPAPVEHGIPTSVSSSDMESGMLASASEACRYPCTYCNSTGPHTAPPPLTQEDTWQQNIARAAMLPAYEPLTPPDPLPRYTPIWEASLEERARLEMLHVQNNVRHENGQAALRNGYRWRRSRPGVMVDGSMGLETMRDIHTGRAIQGFPATVAATRTIGFQDAGRILAALGLPEALPAIGPDGTIPVERAQSVIRSYIIDLGSEFR